ncbi:ATP-dependent DNA helicase [Patulibacter sp.]|uniref:ATP-dependent helicase n=1 Tax=Patulibacter sp. TaxID=1912859 RepID=UPI00271F5B4E|nr:ATP-dependent DNA helicase [Patulibacter sp.]MDO9410272.1 ATP-dependent DNA helicase [Patulibacter sp.]
MEPLDGLSDAQVRVATHGADGPPLLVRGTAGTGKSTALAARAAWLVTAVGADPTRIAVLGATPAAAARTRRRLDERLGPAAADVVVTTLPDLGHRLLRDVAEEVGVDPFVVPATRNERVALLLEHREELGLLHHDGGSGGRGHIGLLASAVARIDRLKESLVDAEELGRWAGGLADVDPRAPREREFAQLMRLHDRVLRERGLIDHGDLLLHLVRLLEDPTPRGDRVRERVGGAFAALLVDDIQDLPTAAMRLLHALVRCGTTLTAAGDDDQATRRVRAAAPKNLRDLVATYPDLGTVALERSWRSPARVLRAAEAVVEPAADRLPHAWHAPSGGSVRFWRATSERAQAQAVAGEVERLLRDGARPDRIAVLVPSVRREAGPVVAALEELAVPTRLGGAGAFLERVEVRDVLAWLRLLVDPSDAPAVSRALARPPIDLRPADLARCMQLARRRRMDLVGALAASMESPQMAPEARDRVAAFLRLYRSATRALDVTPPDQFVHRLVEHLGLRRQQLFGDNGDVVERLRDLARVGQLAERHVRIAPQSTARDFARWLILLAEAGGDPDGKVEAVPFAAGMDGDPPGDEPDAGGRTSRTGAVRVLPLEAAAELELDHVFVLGLQSSRLGAIGAAAGRRLVDPLPDELLGDDRVGGRLLDAGDGRSGAADVADPSRAIAIDEARRALHVAMTRAREGVVLAYPERATSGAAREPSSMVEDARRAVDGEWEELDERLFGPDDTLHATFRTLRDDLLRDVATIGARLGDLRMDTDLDVAHGVTRYLELMKVAALINRPEGQEVAAAMPAVDGAIRQAATAQQKEILLSSSLDEDILAAAGQTAERRAAGRGEPSLEPFLPLRDDGVVMSAGDLFVYGSCPLRYKFNRVLRIPQQPTVAQRFGIVVHQVLERWHGRGGTELAELQELLTASWRRSGLQGSADEARLWSRAQDSMARYHARTTAEDSETVWLERGFEFRLGDHTLRGRVDRVDRHPDGAYELVDYKTGRPRTPEQLRDDVQLQLYAVAAVDAWGLEAPRQSYHYILDDVKTPLEAEGGERAKITSTVERIGDAILAQDFEPTPSYETCAMCDYQLTCPAAET